MGGIMSIVLQGSTSGSVTLQEPAIAGSTVLTLPAVSGTILTTGSSGQSIPKAALPTGSVLQVVQTVKSDTFSITTSSSWQDITGMSVSITPTSSTSKILVLADIAGNGTSQSATVRLVRGSTAIFTGDAAGSRPLGSANWLDNSQYAVEVRTIIYLDSPATTSSTTYKLQIVGSSATWYLNRSATDRDTANFDPRTASSITVMEIAA